MMQDLKERFLKYGAVHGLYKIPMGIMIICLVYDNLSPAVFFSTEIFQLKFILHLMALSIGLKSLFEGLHDLFHNPVKRQVKIDSLARAREKRINAPK